MGAVLPLKPEKEFIGAIAVVEFDPVDSTPDLADEGALRARVTAAADEPTAGGTRLTAAVESPPLLRGHQVALWARYEEETLEGALKGGRCAVNASITDREGRVVGGGLARVRFERGAR
jgi:hypothetical protein